MLAPRRRALLLFAIAVVALALRVYRLAAWPVFIDEDVFTAAVIELKGVSFADLLAVTGKTMRPPLPAVIQAGAGYVLGDPLLGGRALSVAAGTLTTLLSYALGRRVGGPAVGVLAALLYAVAPLAVLHERMVLQDGLLSACSLATVLVGWRALERGGWRSTLGAAGLGALAVQIKLPAVTLALVLFIARWIYRRPRQRGAAVRAAVMYAAPMASLAGAVVPFPGAVAGQVADRWSPLDAVAANSTALFEAIVTYLPAGLWLLPPVGAVLLARSQPRTAALLLAAIACWTAPWLILSNFAPSRYYLPALPFVLTLAALALISAWQARRMRVQARRVGVLAAVAAAVVVAVPAWNSVRLAADLRAADLTTLDAWQYRFGWPSGFAYDDAARFIAGALEPDASLAYLVDTQHRVGAGVFDPKPARVHLLGTFTSPRSLVRLDAAPLLVVIDDPRTERPGQQLEEFQALHPDAQVLLHTLRPDAQTGVAVVRLP